MYLNYCKETGHILTISWITWNVSCIIQKFKYRCLQVPGGNYGYSKLIVCSHMINIKIVLLWFTPINLVIKIFNDVTHPTNFLVNIQRQDYLSIEIVLFLFLWPKTSITFLFRNLCMKIVWMTIEFLWMQYQFQTWSTSDHMQEWQLLSIASSLIFCGEFRHCIHSYHHTSSGDHWSNQFGNPPI